MYQPFTPDPKILAVYDTELGVAVNFELLTCVFATTAPEQLTLPFISK